MWIIASESLPPLIAMRTLSPSLIISKSLMAAPTWVFISLGISRSLIFSGFVGSFVLKSSCPKGSSSPYSSSAFSISYLTSSFSATSFSLLSLVKSAGTNGVFHCSSAYLFKLWLNFWRISKVNEPPYVLISRISESTSLGNKNHIW